MVMHVQSIASIIFGKPTMVWKNPSLLSSSPPLWSTVVSSTVMCCGKINMNLSCKTCHYSAESWLGNSRPVSISQCNVPVAKNPREERVWVCTGMLFMRYVGVPVESGASCWQTLTKTAQMNSTDESHISMNELLFFPLLYILSGHHVVSSIVSDYSVSYSDLIDSWLVSFQQLPINQFITATIVLF